MIYNLITHTDRSQSNLNMLNKPDYFTPQKHNLEEIRHTNFHNETLIYNRVRNTSIHALMQRKLLFPIFLVKMNKIKHPVIAFKLYRTKGKYFTQHVFKLKPQL